MPIRLCTTRVQRCLCPGLCPFLSSEPTILLAWGRDRELWPGWLRIRNEYSVHTQTQGRRIVDSGDENGVDQQPRFSERTYLSIELRPYLYFSKSLLTNSLCNCFNYPHFPSAIRHPVPALQIETRRIGVMTPFWKNNK